MKKKILITFLMSMLVFILTSWTLAYSHYAASMAESCCFFLLTFHLLESYAKPNTYGIPYVLAIIVGRIILEMPLRVMEFKDTLPSLFIPMTVIVSILLAALYYKEKRLSVLILSVSILIILTTMCQYEWFEFFNNSPKK